MLKIVNRSVPLALKNLNYTEEQIEKLWGGYLLRVLDEAVEITKSIQSKLN